MGIIFILMVIIVRGPTGDPVVTMQDFDSENTCIVARELVRKTIREIRARRVGDVAECVKK